LGFFDSFDKDFLNVIINGDKVKNLNFLSIFPPDKYNEIFIVSYVSSYKFFFENIKDFEKATIILGEEENISRFLSFNVKEMEELLKEIKDFKIARKILNNEIKFRYISEDFRLHSKIYFASGENNIRVAVGSANFTLSAFESNQFEELLVFDFEPYISLYQQRIDFLLKKSKDILSPTVKKKIKDSFINCQELAAEEINSSLISSANVQAKNINDSVIEAENLQAEKISHSVVIAENISDLSIDTGIILTPKDKQEIALEKCIEAGDKISEPAAVLNKAEEEIEKIFEIEEEIKTTNELLTKITKSRNKKIVFKPKNDIKKMSDVIKVSVVKTSEKSEDYIRKRRYFVFKNYNIFEQDGDRLAPFAEKIPVMEEVINQAKKLRAFIKSYSLFTVNKEKSNEKKVTEAILFSLMSSFVWLMRRKTAELHGKEKLAEIPLMMIMGGQANTGKSKLLFFINKMLGNNYEVYNYQEIDVRGQRVIADMLETENIFPLLVDEVEQKLFDSNTGQMLIKSATNKLVNPHPCFIGTTNKEFSPRAEIVRRLYYINFSDPFLMSYSKEKEEADRYLTEEVGEVNDTVFKYFVNRMLLFIRDDSDTFFTINDPLYSGRKILKEIFSMAKVDYSCISREFIGDFYRTSSIEWKNIFVYHRDMFKSDKIDKEDVYLVDLNTIAMDTGYKRKADILKNKLPPDVLKSSGETVIALRKQKFLDFIGVKDYNNALLKKLFGFLVK
jgi:hypothetical protein